MTTRMTSLRGTMDRRWAECGPDHPQLDAAGVPSASCGGGHSMLTARSAGRRLRMDRSISPRGPDQGVPILTCGATWSSGVRCRFRQAARGAEFVQQARMLARPGDDHPCGARPHGRCLVQQSVGTVRDPARIRRETIRESRLRCRTASADDSGFPFGSSRDWTRSGSVLESRES